MTKVPEGRYHGGKEKGGGSMTKRQEQAQASRRKIFETAKGLIGEKGYQNVTISQIVQACGMSVGNFYHYFSSKDEVILYVERSLYGTLPPRLSREQVRELLSTVHRSARTPPARAK